MKFIDEFRDNKLIHNIAKLIHNICDRDIVIMEVCGGHTVAIQKWGLPSLLPHNIELLSGPGCPVCVTDIKFIDHAIALCKIPEVIITTYGDLMRVPGSSSTLMNEKSKGADVRMVYSVLDAFNIALNNPSKKVVFLAIGFETTAPMTAVAVQKAKKMGLKNFFVLCAHKIIPPAMSAIIEEGIPIQGYIAPGHVSTITGPEIYENLVNKYQVACVISGFEPLDLMQSILMIIKQIKDKKFRVENQYRRAVFTGGNPKAKELINKVFRLNDQVWRGLGVIKQSGLQLNEDYENFDAEKMIEVHVEPSVEIKGCICGEILKGLKKPTDCSLFSKVCTPANPMGACMVSHEGACQAYYRYRKQL